MAFEPDLTDPLVAKAAALATMFAADAVARDKAGGRPTEQVRLLKQSGLLSAQIGKEYGGQGAGWLSVLRAVREIAKADGSMADLYGNHHVPRSMVLFLGSEAQKRDLLGGSAAEHWLWAPSSDATSKIPGGRRDGDDWILNGVRPSSSGTHVADRIALAWDGEAGERYHAVVSADRDGLVTEDDWDGIGLRQSGAGTLTLNDVRVHGAEILGTPDRAATPWRSLESLIRQCVQLNVCLGNAQGALIEGRAYTVSTSRPWIHSSVLRHIDDPWVRRIYGGLFIKIDAATELADAAARALQAAWAQGAALTPEQRVAAAIEIATADVRAAQVGLEASSRIFEVTGARSATNEHGFDRFWRNVRTHTLHNPAEYKTRSLGTFFLTKAVPDQRDASRRTDTPEIVAPLFEPDASNRFVAQAAMLRDTFGLDAAARDRAGGRPTEQIRLLKESGLLRLLIPRAFGGSGEPHSTALKIVREFAKVDGALGHIYGYHFGPLQNAHLRGSADQAAELYRASAAGNWFWGNTVNSFSKSLFGRRDADGWVLDGHRPFSSGSHVADYLSVAWEDHLTDERFFAAIPADRTGITVEDDWDGIGQRQTGSGTVTYRGVRVHESEVLKPDGNVSEPFRTLGPQWQQSVLLNVFVGSAQGALLAARDYTMHQTRPGIGSGVADHADDLSIERRYGELIVMTEAAAALADKAAIAFDAAWAKGRMLSEDERGRAAITIAAANVLAGDTALDVTSEIFEIMGPRSAARPLGFDRFWRNVRTHTLHNPAEYKTRNVGTWVLSGRYPDPGTFQ